MDLIIRKAMGGAKQQVDREVRWRLPGLVGTRDVLSQLFYTRHKGLRAPQGELRDSLARYERGHLTASFSPPLLGCLVPCALTDSQSTVKRRMKSNIQGTFHWAILSDINSIHHVCSPSSLPSPVTLLNLIDMEPQTE